MTAYSIDLRVRVLADCDEGMTTKDVAAKYRVSTAWARRLKQRRRQTGSIAPKVQRHGPSRLRSEQAARVAEAVEKAPDATLDELRRDNDLPLSSASLWRVIRELGLTYELKSPRAAERGRPDVKRLRDGWAAKLAGVAAEHLVFLDETSATTKMTRRRGRCPEGKRLVMTAPHGHRKTTTLVVALRLGGLTAPTVIDGAMTGDLFLAYVKQQLVPTLREGDVVVMDNLGCHEKAGVVEAVEKAGARVEYLPPYSRDFNPIELAFSKLRALLRKAGERTVDGLWRSIGRLMDEFTPSDGQGFFTHCGYPATPT